VLGITASMLADTDFSGQGRGMRRSVMRQSAAGVRGFSLIEVLISIIVLSFGMLGMVGMQAAALQSNREARLQSVAYGLAQELAEMMRGNKDVAVLPPASNPYLVALQSPLAPATVSYCLNVGSNCAGTALSDQTTLAQAQLTEWLARVDQELPGARVVVCEDTAPYDATSDLPQWPCTPPGVGTVAQAYVKIGWNQSSTNRAAAPASAIIYARDNNSRPGLVFPVISGRTNAT
jgi:type IV pilus assembly protein PilV